MIPQKLQIKNFLSYGSTIQTVDFSSHSLICLSGKNGHGKSALLDAMTWALWGQARKVLGAAKADQGLLRLGQTHMLVIFDFEFGNKIYRIRREYMETHGKPIAVLEFGMIDTLSQTFIPLTDKTVRTTQDKIEQTLRIDFDSFSNSAFLRQGSSNEFSKKSPKDRKQILATILGLDQYEVIRKLAQDKIKDAQNKKIILTTLQEKRVQELAAQDTLDAELQHLTAQMIAIADEEKQLTHAHAMHLQNRTVYDEQHKQYHNFSFQIQQLTTHATTHKKQLRELLAQWRMVNKKKQSLHNVHQLELAKNKIIATIADHQKMFQDNLEQQQALLTITTQLNSIEQHHNNALTQQHHALQLELERLDAQHKNSQTVALNIEQQIKQHNTDDQRIALQITTHMQELSRLTHKPDAITQAEAHLEKRKAAYQHFVTLGNWINSELANMAQKKKLVHADDPSCPLCEQNLSASRRRFLKLNFEKQEAFFAHRLRRLKHIIPRLKEILIAQHASIIKDKETALLATTHASKITELTAARATVVDQIALLASTAHQHNEEVAAQAHTITLKQQQIVAQLAATADPITDTVYCTLKQHKQQLEQKLTTHIYQKNDYQTAQQELKNIELQLTEHHAISKEIAHQENRKHDINKLCTTLKLSNAELGAIEHKRAALGDLDLLAQILQTKEKEFETERAAVKNKKEMLLHAKGSIENQHKHLTKITDEFQQEQKNILALDAVVEDYQAIATATGKDGIQALLIEDAIPEIEHEANHLLSRLTNNQAQIFIESLRDLKKGGTKETLDIKISDQAGIRPYELFSGGEAFRIDFALRIAISKLLARRAGTALQTLIIDEGFGSQDEEGLGHIMDALHKIQDDFSKIIIVSHLPAMKDQFPVQFFVEKGVQGSMVTVIEQG